MKESLRLQHLMGDRLGVGAAMEVLAWLIAGTDPERTAVLMGAAQNEWDLIETSIQTLPGLDVRHEAALSAARGVLGDEAYRRDPRAEHPQQARVHQPDAAGRLDR